MAHMCRILLHCFLITGCIVDAIDPISTTIMVGIGAFASGIVWKLDTTYESCNWGHTKWIKFNSSKLEHALNKRLFGQHIASPLILKTLKGHMYNLNSEKPLVLSLHGWTGTGKTFVSKMIAESIYNKGMQSKFVHLFTATIHFPHQKHLETYKEQLQMWVKGNVTKCPHSMFIFDEMDKMQAGLIDSIKPYLDYHNNLDGVSYRKAIFIFLSNLGGQRINEVALDFRNNGRDREEIQLKDLETAVSHSIFNTKGAFWHASMIDTNLVDVYVPFLPLERKHVVQCVLAEMRSRCIKPDQNVAQRMAQEMISGGSIYSTKGCKTISKRLHFYI